MQPDLRDAGPPPDSTTSVSPVRRMGWRGRAVAGLVLCGCLAVLGVAAYLQPDSRGYGTHQQLGMGACGMLIRTGYPCPTCGMTTAFAYAIRGRLLAAFYAQPAGLALALASAAVTALSGWAVFTGRLPTMLLREPSPHLLFWLLLLLLVGGWGIKLVWGLLDGSLPVRHVRL